MTKKKKAILIIVLIVVVLGICAGTFLYFKDKEEQKKKLIREEKALVEKIKNSYSKYIVVSNLNVLDSVNIIPNFLNITYVTNSGGAFSILSGSRYFFIILGIIAIIYLIKYIMSDSNITKVDLIAYSLVISGIIGNLIDRIIYGYVIDYIHFYISSYSFAIFNFADMCIVIGAIIIIYILFIKGDSYENNNSRK